MIRYLFAGLPVSDYRADVSCASGGYRHGAYRGIPVR